MTESVLFEGGPLDGTEAQIKPEASARGMVVHVQPESHGIEETWYGYFATDRVTSDGRRIFRTVESETP